MMGCVRLRLTLVLATLEAVLLTLSASAQTPTTNSIAWPTPLPVPTPLPGYNIIVHGSLGGTFSDFAHQGRYLYRCEGCTLSIVDLQATGQPVIAVVSLPERAVKVYVSGNFAYVLGYGMGLIVIDATNPATPRIKSALPSGLPQEGYINLISSSFADGLLCSHIRYNHYDNGSQIDYRLIIVMDVHNPAVPVVKSTIPDNAEYWYDFMAFSGKILYIYDYNNIQGLIRRIDLRDPGNPHNLSPIESKRYLNDMSAYGGYLYVAADAHNMEKAGLEIYDIRNPDAPHLARFIDLPPSVQSGYGTRFYSEYRKVNLKPGRARLITLFREGSLDLGVELRLLDTTDPTSPTLIKTKVLSQSFNLKDNWQFNGGGLWIEDNGYFIYSTEEDKIEFVHSLHRPAPPWAVAASAQSLFFGDVWDQHGQLYMMGLNSMGQPEVLAQAEISSDTAQLHVDNGLTYASTSKDIKILNMDDFSHPEQIGVIPGQADFLSLADEQAVISNGTTLTLFNIQNPARPSRLASFHVPDEIMERTLDPEGRPLATGHPMGNNYYSYSITGLDLKSNFACLTVNDYFHSYWEDPLPEYYEGEWRKIYFQSRLEIVDFSSSPSLVFHEITTSTEILYEPTIIDGYACCLSDHGNQVKIFDIHNPEAPAIVGRLNHPMSAKKLVTKDNLLYLIGECANGIWENRGMLVVADISDPLHPFIQAQQQLPRVTDQLAIGNGLIFIATGQDYMNYDHRGIFALSYRGPRPMAPLRITGLDKPGYVWSRLKDQSRVYTDRSYTYTIPVPSGLDNQICLQPPNNDKNLTSGNVSFAVNRPVRVFLALPDAVVTPPSWMASWKPHGYRIVTSVDPAPGRNLYYKDFGAGTITLGPNRDASMPLHTSMYIAVIVPKYSAVDDWAKYR